MLGDIDCTLAFSLLIKTMCISFSCIVKFSRKLVLRNTHKYTMQY